MRFSAVLITALILVGCGMAWAQQQPLGMLNEIPVLKDYKAMRASSADPNWQNGNGDARPIQPGQTLTVAELKGPGRIVHIWFTIADREKFYGKKLVLKMYWDGEKTPSVESPMNDFFCEGHGLDYPVNSLPFRVTSNGRGRNCYFPMPFAKSARIEVTNEGKEVCGALYYYVDWQKLPELPKDSAYFHAKYRQEFPCKSGDDYLILNALGKGHYVGCNLSVRCNEPSWWGEGDDFFYIDGEKEPSLRGTGSEDYFCDGWGLRQIDGLYYGCPLMEGLDTLDRTTAYRFHIPDPVPFTKSLKVTIEHKGAGPLPDGKWTGFKERADDFSSVAYWYQVEPHVEFTKMPPVDQRLYPSTSIEIEGESLIPSVEAGKGFVQQQGIGEASGGAHLFFTPPDQEQARLGLKFQVEKAGDYDVRLHMIKSWDYGIYRILLDGKEIGKPVDLYSADVVATTAKLGRLSLTAGEHSLRFECIGKNDASKGYFFGLDMIELLPAK